MTRVPGHGSRVKWVMVSCSHGSGSSDVTLDLTRVTRVLGHGSWVKWVMGHMVIRSLQMTLTRMTCV